MQSTASRLANRHQAINLAQGFPDFDPPPVLIEALERSARGPFLGYLAKDPRV